MAEAPITELLGAARDGDNAAAEAVFTAIYGELRRLAQSHRRQWLGNDTINTTALINEAYLKLAGHGHADWQNRTHFYATASRAMRQVLMNYAEKAGAAKRGGGEAAIAIDDVPLAGDSTADELLRLLEQIQPLEQSDPRRCRIVECRVFGGLSVPETAEALGISPATVKREWRIAAALLKRGIDEDPNEP
ncbi:MAG: ECF-type sigma factor [Pseudomonadota bacterium]